MRRCAQFDPKLADAAVFPRPICARWRRLGRMSRDDDGARRDIFWR
jgi:hypothetical protein